MRSLPLQHECYTRHLRWRAFERECEISGTDAADGRLLLTGGANEGFHMVEIAFEGSPARGREAVLCFGQPAIKHFGAIDISSFLELTGVYGEISVGGSEQGFQFIESERGIDRESADDSEAHALVDQAIEDRK